MIIFIWFLMSCCIAQMVIIHKAIKVINQWKDLAETLEKEAEEWEGLANKAVEVIEQGKETHDCHGSN